MHNAPVSDRDHAEYSGIIYWYRNKKGDAIFGATDGVRFENETFRKTNSPGPRNKLQKAIPTNAYYFAHIHIHFEDINGNQNFSRDDEQMFVNRNNSGLLNYYLVTPGGAIRFRNVDSWNGFEYWVR
ncbi:MAG: DUF4329 domain-containing protein [Oligoflexus sp.]|nr:DUF4329 domain-containing protein [Pseudopedobacter sp.]